jgi:HD superfamily phosphohydrolase
MDSAPFQRLRHIHQLAMTYLVYPGATHRRFEHSLGVMELVSRIYDVVTDSGRVHPTMRDLMPEKGSASHQYWRHALRMAALCHDIGHLPFSHAAEKELLPEGWDHERMTIELIRSPAMRSIWEEMTPPLRTEDVIKLAVGPDKYREHVFTDWEIILSETIVGNVFGADRMDYLLRDSYHAGVAYGSFDRYRLIDTLRVLPREDQGSSEPALGLEEGGLHSAEALMLARYFMYQQVYFHPVRRIYDIDLKEFLKEWLPNGSFGVKIEKYLAMTDAEVTAAILAASRNYRSRAHKAASKITNRQHFKVLYQRNPADHDRNPDASKIVYDAGCGRFGSEFFRHDSHTQRGESIDFPVLMRDGRIASSRSMSDTLNRVPVAVVDYVFVDRSKLEDARGWLEREREGLIAGQEREQQQ